jgi:hypothetical protein
VVWLRERKRKSGIWYYVVMRDGSSVAAGQQLSAAQEILEEANRIEVPEPWDPPKGEITGCVYFIETDSGDIKIGYSEKSPLQRLRALQTACPMKLKLLAATPGNAEYERRLHARFDWSRIRGEWFQPTPSLRSFIRRIAQQSQAISR